MKLNSKRRHSLIPLLILVLLSTLTLALAAADARASGGGMDGMPGMTE